MKLRKVSSNLFRVIVQTLFLILSHKYVIATGPEASSGAVEGHPKKTAAEIKDILVKSKIIPDVITLPASHVVEVAYGESIVNFGNNLTKAQVAKEPTYLRWPTDKDAFYTIILSGYHRFVFTVYRQPGKTKFDEHPRPAVPLESYRGRFSTDEFGRKYKFGDPHAVNFFISKWSNLDGSEFVPISHYGRDEDAEYEAGKDNEELI
nr:PREDICTED: protein D1-like isoform X2 [Bemisia tabaci]